VWEQIQSNRRRSVVVVVAMGVLLVVVGMALGALFGPGRDAVLIGGALAFGIWLVMWMVALRQGDQIMLRMAGAREIQHKDHPVLFNVVEEMSIAAQLAQRPRVYIVDDPSPNAFATGRDPKRASVAVTTGLLRILDRDELQGVVGHEIGHIRNRDVSLITTAGVMVGSIVMLAEIGLRVMWYSGGGRRSRSSSRDGGGQAVIFIVALLLLILAPILAQLLYFALSRRREYLADASSAMFTRYPEGLASALEKLGGDRTPLADTSRVTAPMYIVLPARSGGGRASLYDTHPPLKDRIRVLRTMAGGADPGAYEAAYRAVRGRSIVGARTLVGSQHLDVRAASEAPAGPPPLPTTHERARQASDAFLSASGYGRRTCSDCGATVKIPPSVADRVTKCPRCQGQLGPWTE
jgi:heat shock protein HtpX